MDDDERDWLTRTFKRQRERRDARLMLSLLIVLAFVLVGITIMVLWP